ncbi:sensor histidine kinase RegB [Acidimangrovimonas pyrenivorans]|uniref:histidine kinase n=1 Tax=Acidimangrovimonas pyrenivorans TaxID=2030798 RepID=A0ABV7AKP8_9RHOB
MTQADPGLFHSDTSSDWVRLRTLIMLRWMAIAGQALAITVADRVFHLQIDTGLCYVVVLASMVANLGAIFVYPKTKRLAEYETMIMLLFDLGQLTLLLFLTGGLNNPFALLILAPVTISASALHLRTTILLGLVAIALISFLSYFHLHLLTADGSVLEVPAIFHFGFWAALVIGIVFIALYSRRVATEARTMSDALLATQMALAREQKLTDLGGVVAAAAHELGTPLATIKLVSSELMEELADRPELAEDARLVRDQADRCRDILRSMGRAGKDDLQLRIAPLAAVIREAAEPHMDRGKQIHFNIGPAPGGDEGQPSVRRQPEIIHGLRNLIQNAVDFARSTVWVDAEWNDRAITIRIADDGPGYPPQIIGRIGDPFVRWRSSAEDRSQRPEYEGMGLGLFIAKTLLERTGAELSFANGTDPFLTEEERPMRSGAIVAAVWPRGRISPESREALGENQQIRS